MIYLPLYLYIYSSVLFYFILKMESRHFSKWDAFFGALMMPIIAPIFTVLVIIDRIRK